MANCCLVLNGKENRFNRFLKVNNCGTSKASKRLQISGVRSRSFFNKKRKLRFSEDIGHANNEIFFIFQSNSGASVRSIVDKIAERNGGRLYFTILHETTRAHGDNMTTDGLFLGRIGDEEAANGFILLLDHLDEQAIENGVAGSLGIIAALELAQDVILSDDGVAISVVIDIGTAVFAIHDNVTLMNLHGDFDAVSEELARADLHGFAKRGLLLGVVRQDDAARRHVRGFTDFDHDVMV